jgi:asparagine synthase (glutamine-hydrolysing)
MSRWLAAIGRKEGSEIAPATLLSSLQVYRHWMQTAEVGLGTQSHQGQGFKVVEQYTQIPVAAAFAVAQPALIAKGPCLQATESDDLCIVWDGQLLNAASLCRQFHLPADSADVEIILHGYRNLGPDLLQHLQGRWSFCLYDRGTNRYWLARDAIGVKPLYYYQGENHWYFGSEPKLLLALPGVTRAIHQPAVFDYFVGKGVDKGRSTLFSGIHQLLPGEMAFLQGDQWKTKSWFVPPQPRSFQRFSVPKGEEAKQEIKRLLTEAVQANLDKWKGVSVATLLSGGLDSSVLTAILANSQSSALPTYTAAYPDAGIGEQSFAQKVVDRWSTKAHILEPQLAGLQDDLEDFIYSQDTPTFSSGTYSQYCLFRATARDGRSVVFDGQGADGMLGGHQFHYPAYWEDLLRAGSWRDLLRETAAFGGSAKALKYGLSTRLRHHTFLSLPQNLQLGIKRRYFPELGLLQPELVDGFSERLPTSHSSFSLNPMMHQGFFGGGTAFLLKCVDRAAHWFGVETAFPFVDTSSLRNWAFDLSAAYKIHEGRRKWVMAEGFKEWLPSEVYNRTDKKGLLTPNNRWMAGLRDQVRPMLLAQDDQIFRKEKLLTVFDDFFAPPDSLENYRTYKYLSFIVWRQVFGV